MVNCISCVHCTGCLVCMEVAYAGSINQILLQKSRPEGKEKKVKRAEMGGFSKSAVVHN